MSEKQYTDSQKMAIGWNDGPAIILAGPGSGKTAVLTERIKRIISEKPNEAFRILALTFTNKAAAEMSKRISEGLDNQEHRLFIGTFHSFCSNVLRNHGTYVGLGTDFDIFNSVEDLNEIVNELAEEYKECYPYVDISNLKLLNAIQYFERKLCITEQDMDDVMPKTTYSSTFKWFYNKYIEKMLSLNAVEFDLLLLLTYKLFVKYPNITRIYRSMYKYINIDEFQDTNDAQYTLIKTLCGEKHKNVFVVADDDQVIYGWNGASHKRLTEYRVDFNAELIQLYQNFRCPSEVVGLANKLIQHNSGRTENKKPLEAMKTFEEESKHVFVKRFNSFEEEVAQVIGLVKEIKSKYPEETICIIARTNRLLDNVYEKATQEKLDCVKARRKDNFETPYVLLIYDLLKLANHRNDEKVFYQIIGLLELIFDKSINAEHIMLDADLDDGDLLKAICNHLSEWTFVSEIEKSIRFNLCEGRNFLMFIEDAFEWCDGLIDNMLLLENGQQQKEEYLAEKKVWLEFERNLKYNYEIEEITLSTYMQEFAMISKEAEPKEDVVQLLTVHASKGKEFDNVILIGMVNDELPSFQSIKRGLNSTELEEERRNCFVAITRTQKRLFMTYSKVYFGWNKQMSMFLSEMFNE